jgi:hypothetical protein
MGCNPPQNRSSLPQILPRVTSDQVTVSCNGINSLVSSRGPVETVHVTSIQLPGSSIKPTRSLDSSFQEHESTRGERQAPGAQVDTVLSCS